MIQTIYDIVKAQGGDPNPARRQAGSYREKVETKEARPDDPVGRGKGLPAEQAGSTFNIYLPIK